MGSGTEGQGKKINNLWEFAKTDNPEKYFRLTSQKIGVYLFPCLFYHSLDSRLTLNFYVCSIFFIFGKKDLDPKGIGFSMPLYGSLHSPRLAVISLVWRGRRYGRNMSLVLIESLPPLPHPLPTPPRPFHTRTHSPLRDADSE